MYYELTIDIKALIFSPIDYIRHTLEEYFWLFDNSVLKGVTAKLVDAVFSGRLPKGDVRTRFFPATPQTLARD